MQHGHVFWMHANEDLDVRTFNKIWEILNSALYRATCETLCSENDFNALKKCIVTLYIAPFDDDIDNRPRGGIGHMMSDSLKRIQETLDIINQKEFQRNPIDRKNPKIFYQATVKQSTSETNATVLTFYLKVIEPT